MPPQSRRFHFGVAAKMNTIGSDLNSQFGVISDKKLLPALKCYLPQAFRINKFMGTAEMTIDNSRSVGECLRGGHDIGNARGVCHKY